MPPSSEGNIGLNKSAALFQYAEDEEVRAKVYKNYVTNPNQRMTSHTWCNLNQELHPLPWHLSRAVD